MATINRNYVWGAVGCLLLILAAMVAMNMPERPVPVIYGGTNGTVTLPTSVIKVKAGERVEAVMNVIVTKSNIVTGVLMGLPLNNDNAVVPVIFDNVLLPATQFGGKEGLSIGLQTLPYTQPGNYTYTQKVLFFSKAEIIEEIEIPIEVQITAP